MRCKILVTQRQMLFPGLNVTWVLFPLFLDCLKAALPVVRALTAPCPGVWDKPPLVLSGHRTVLGKWGLSGSEVFQLVLLCFCLDHDSSINLSQESATILDLPCFPLLGTTPVWDEAKARICAEVGPGWVWYTWSIAAGLSGHRDEPALNCILLPISTEGPIDTWIREITLVCLLWSEAFWNSVERKELPPPSVFLKKC